MYKEHISSNITYCCSLFIYIYAAVYLGIQVFIVLSGSKDISRLSTTINHSELENIVRLGSTDHNFLPSIEVRSFRGKKDFSFVEQDEVPVQALKLNVTDLQNYVDIMLNVHVRNYSSDNDSNIHYLTSFRQCQ